MYIFPKMLEMTNVTFKSEAHRKVAENILLCNPLVTTMNSLTDGCEKINKIPKTKIKEVTLADLPKYGLSLFVSTQ